MHKGTSDLLPPIKRLIPETKEKQIKEIFLAFYYELYHFIEEELDSLETE